MKKALIILGFVICIFLSSCGTYSIRNIDKGGRSDVELFIKGGYTYEMVAQDMKICRFNNRYDNMRLMTNDEWLKSSFCMEDKEYSYSEKGSRICDYWREHPLCQERIKQGK